MKNLNDMITEIKKRLYAQKLELETKYQDLTQDDVQNIVFGENDVVESFLKENDICEDDVDLEYLRDLQHAMVQDLELCPSSEVYEKIDEEYGVSC